MTIIPLRAYNREIAGMIDNSQLDEAVAHCRHILTTYPKNIATYRLLGKAHLEQQRISDATDIFQRVLSSVPDDFIANVGLSIIREDENNLDAAIWHMELAYEAQPANVAIQDELRRLYGRRDGIQPPKVRLTRGALARMYAKGGLFDQSIAELRAAIAEDPNRPDLQLLLAEMYYQTSQRVEAVETCTNIVKKIPYCLVANRILAISLSEAEGSEAVKNYQQITISLDPYIAFATPEAISSDQVPEDAVNIERLDWKSGIQVEGIPAQPNWATSLGISIEKPEDENLPDWLKSAAAPPPSSPGEQVSPSVSPFIWDTQEVDKIITDTSKPEAEIPDWMKDAGWQPATGEATQPPEEKPSEEPLEGLPGEEAIEKGEIPEWLRGIAPEGAEGVEQPDSSQPEADLSTPWLEQHQPGPTDSIIQWLDEKKPDTNIVPPARDEDLAAALDEEIPDWLKDLDVPQPPSTSAEEPAAATPAFLEEPTALESAEAETPAVEQPVEQAEELATPEAEALPAAEVSPPMEALPTEPAELPPSEVAEVEETLPTEAEIEAPVELPEAEQALSAESVAIPTAETVEPEELAAEAVEEIPDWLKELAEEQPSPEALSTEAEETAVETPPISKEAGAEAPALIEETPTEEQPIPAEEFPASTAFVEPQEAEQQEMPAGIVEQITSEAPSIAEEVPSSEVPMAAGEVPVSEAPLDVEEQPQAEVPVLPEEELPATEPVAAGEFEDLSWLKEIADEQAAGGEELTAPAEAAEISAPEWLKLEAEPPLEEALQPEATTEPGSAIPAEEIPEWIKGLGEEPETQPAAEEPEIQPTTEELEIQPATEELEIQPATEELEIQPAAEETEAVPAAEEPEIQPAAEEPVQEIAPPAEIPSAEELPDWLLELKEPEAEAEQAVSPDEALEWKADELPAWLKEIAESEPAAEEPAIEARLEEELPTPPVEEAPAPEEEVLPEMEVGEEALAEQYPEPASLVSEVEEPVQPVSEVQLEAEIPAAPPLEEQLAEAADLAVTQPEALTPTPQAYAEQNQKALSEARDAIDQGQPTQAVDSYLALIKQNYQLDEIIKDLTDALDHYPVDVEMWVTLGDAYFRKDSLQEALDAYTKAEELAR
ncbi:MAG: tetratricopeptide repeat protein [Anaerolineales bacterium]